MDVDIDERAEVTLPGAEVALLAIEERAEVALPGAEVTLLIVCDRVEVALLGRVEVTSPGAKLMTTGGGPSMKSTPWPCLGVFVLR